MHFKIYLIFFCNNKKIYKIIGFKDNNIAKQYHKIAYHKANFKFAGLFEECVNWCKKNKYDYEIIIRNEYNQYE